jgi:Tol biopolymer transport system component
MRDLDSTVWSAVERHLAAVEAFVPQTPPWRPAGADDQAVRARVVLGPAFGSGLARRSSAPRWTLALLVLGLIAALVAGALLGVGQRETPVVHVPAGRNGIIAFDGGDDLGNPTILRVEADGSAARSLLPNTDSAGVLPLAACPAFSADGAQLAYIGATGDLIVAGADASHPHELLGVMPQGQTASTINWSPDGSRIAYIPQGPAVPASVGIATVSVGSVSSIPLSTADQVLALAWSPDDSHLAILALLGHTQIGLLRVAVGGSEIQTLTVFPAGTGPSGLQLGVSWSPDGTRIAYDRWSPAGGSPVTDIFTIGADGTGERQLTHSAVDAYGAVWSPDGQRIGYATRTSSGTGIVRTIASDGSDPVTVHDGQAAQAIVWSPDGARLLISYVDPLAQSGQERPAMQSFAAHGPAAPITYPVDAGTCLPSWQRLAP